METLRLLVEGFCKSDVEESLMLCTKILNSSIRSHVSISQVDHLIRQKLVQGDNALDYVTILNRLSRNKIPKLEKILYFIYLVSNNQQSHSKMKIPSLMFIEKGFTMPKPVQHMDMDVKEDIQLVAPLSNICKDLFYTFQGIDATLVQFVNNKVHLNVTVSAKEADMVKELMKLSLMGFQMKLFVNTKCNSFLLRSIQDGVEQELRIMQELSISAQLVTPTVFHLYAQVFPYFYSYNFICTLLKIIEVDSSNINAIIEYLNHGFNSGDELKINLSERLLNLISIPIIDQLFNWMLYGEINDPYNEFFVVVNEENNNFQSPFFWNRCFYIRSTIIPFINDQSQKELIFNVGKSSRLLDLSEKNSKWLIDNANAFKLEHLNLRDKSTTLRFFKSLKLQVDHQVVYVLKEKFQLLESMQFLKDLFFTQRGDLLLQVYHQLDKFLELPANSVIYEASSLVDMCYKQHYANFYHFKLVIFNQTPTSLLWSCISFQPEFPFPLNNVFDNTIIKRYQGMFGFFNSIKYIYFRLSQSWKINRCLYLQVKVNVPQFSTFLRRLCLFNQHYTSIIAQVLYYTLYEVIEQSCNELQSFIASNDYGFQELLNKHVENIKQLRAATSLEGGQHVIWSLLQELHKYLLQQVHFKLI